MVHRSVRSWSLVAAVVAASALSACQWEVPDGPLPDAGGDAADPDASSDAATDAPTDGTPMVTLTILRSGSATGTVTSNAVEGAMIDCGTTCSASFPPGTLVTLSAAPGTGALFAGWAGVCSDAAPNCSFTLDSDTTVQATFDVLRHTITVVPGGNGVGAVTANVGGINCPGTCQATVDHGTSVTLTATPTPPSIFAGWNDAGCTGTSPCTFTVTQDEVVDAAFALNYTVTVSKNGNGSGTVTSSPAGINCGTDCDQVYPAGTMVTLTASAAGDSTFAGWGGACTGTGSCVVQVDAVVAVSATFTLRRYTLTASRTGTGGGVVTSNPTGINCGTDCDELYDHGTEVTLTATPNGVSTFSGWTGAGCSGTAGCVVQMTQARSVSAAFTLNRYQLAVAKAGAGATLGTVTSSPSGITCGTDCDELYDAGTMVTLSASTATGATFTGWSGACTGTGNCTVTMNAAQSVTATFTLNQYTLTVARAGNGAGNGTVTSSPAGINCGGTCSATYTFGQTVTLSASAPTGTTFTGWSGGGCSGTTTCVVTVGADTTVTATFALDTYTLTLDKLGAGTGTATSNPAGINCGTTCATQNASFSHGQVVSLSHTAGADSEFVAWGGACTGATCSVTMTQDRTVSANFKRTDKTLTVTVSGTGTGTVTSVPAGINAPTDGSETYAHGTSVTLTANPNTTTSDFDGWTSGPCMGSTNPICAVTMDQARTVNAAFRIKTYTLTLNKLGAGTGTVTSTPAGLNCGTGCTTQNATFTHGQSVSLSHAAGADSEFVAWGGACTGGMCSVTMTQDRTVSANFKRTDKTLTVTVSGSGTVTSSPAGINAPGDNTETYAHGTMVTLTAAWNATSHTFAWSGACTGSTATCVVTMDQARSVTATFTIRTYTLTVAKAGVGTGTVQSTMPAGIIDCGADCSEVVSHGTMVTLTATPSGGGVFFGWSGGGCSGTGPCTTTVTAATTVTATFDRCVRSTQACSSNQFMQCDATGNFVSHVIPNGGANGTSATITYDGTYICPMGCHASEPRCLDVSATNGLDAALDDPATSPSGANIPHDLGPRTIKAIDTSSFNSANGLTVVTLDDDTPYSLPASVITQAGAPEILVLKVRTFSIPSGSTVTVSGSRALAIVAHFDIYIAGTLDVSGPRGGAGRLLVSGCAGSYLNGASGGGGFVGAGGLSSTGGDRGDGTQSPLLTPLAGGCDGGTGGLVIGGRGGGAAQLVSRTRILLAGTSLVNASGGGGYTGCQTVGCTSYRATGGGAGGAISIEAPVVTIQAGAVVAGRGGNGAASNSGVIGVHGTPGTTAGSTNGPGVSCSGCGTGGVGGTEATISGTNGTGTLPAIGGGGGGVGRCVVRNRTGTISPPAGSMKISQVASALVSR